MAPTTTTTSKRKLTGKAMVRETSSPESTVRERTGDQLDTRQSTGDQITTITPEQQGQTAQPISNTTSLLDQLRSAILDTIGNTVQLTDEQMLSLLGRLASVGPNLPLPTTERPAIPPLPPQPPHGNDLGDSPSGDDSPHGPFRSRQVRPRRTYETPIVADKRSPKHEDPDKLDDGESPTYSSWCLLLEGKLEANADWWSTEQARINYVFSRTTGKAQAHLEPRMSRTSANRWNTVDEILDYLDLIFKNHYEKDEAADEYARITQGSNEDFNDFHSEFSRLASVGEISPSVWRTDLYRKLNRIFQDRLLSTEPLFPSYEQLVQECQRINVRLIEHRRRFPPLTSTRRPVRPVDRPSRTTPRVTGLLRMPSRSPAPLALPAPPKRDSTTPGPRATPAADQAQASCFNCGEVGHFASACLKPRTTPNPRIHEIGQATEASGDEAHSPDDADSESEN
jgi:hypothetical protein